MARIYIINEESKNISKMVDKVETKKVEDKVVLDKTITDRDETVKISCKSGIEYNVHIDFKGMYCLDRKENWWKPISRTINKKFLFNTDKDITYGDGYLDGRVEFETVWGQQRLNEAHITITQLAHTETIVTPAPKIPSYKTYIKKDDKPLYIKALKLTRGGVNHNLNIRFTFPNTTLEMRWSA